MGVFFQDPDISKNIYRFPASPAINDTLSAYRPTSGTSSLNLAKIRRVVPEIFASERKRARSAGNHIVVGEVRKTTTVSLSTGMNSVCASQIRPRSDLPFLRNARMDGHTDRHLYFIYIDIYISTTRPIGSGNLLLYTTSAKKTHFRDTRMHTRMQKRPDEPVHLALWRILHSGN